MNAPSIACPTCGNHRMVSAVRPLRDEDMVQAAMLGGMGLAASNADRKQWLKCEACGTLVRRHSPGRFANFFARLLWGDRGRPGTVIYAKQQRPTHD